MKKVFKHPLTISLLIVGLLIFLALQGWLKIPENIFFQLIAPWQKTIYQISLKINNVINFVKSVNNLNQENIKLSQEKRELLSQITQLKEVVRENEFLRKQVGLINSEQWELVLANVVGQDSSRVGKYFLINKGKKDGITEKAAVIAAGNLLVGRVTEVTDSFSRVQSIIDANSRVNALVQESAITGLVRGGQGLTLIIDLLPQRKEIEVGEAVVTSSLAGDFPAGLLIGQIKKVISSDVQISQQAEIQPVLDFATIEKVFVIKE